MSGLYVHFSGNLGADPETRYTPDGKGILSFRVAVNSRRQVEGEWVDHTDWVRCRVLGGRVESLGNILTKGMRVYVRGRLETTAYINKRTGDPEVGRDVLADDVDFLQRREDNAAPASTPVAAAAPSAPARRGPARQDDGDDDELPFRVPRALSDRADSVLLCGLP